MPVFTHPAGLACRITHYQGVGRHIAYYHGTGTDKRIGAYFNAAYDGGIGAYCGPFSNQCFLYSDRLFTALRGLMTLVKTMDGPRNTSSSHITPV